MREYMRDKNTNDPIYIKYNKILTKIRYLLKTDLNLRYEFELKFDEYMNWENYGIYWEIDHILPIIKMIKLGYTEDEINNIKNIRPLKISDNRGRQKNN